MPRLPWQRQKATSALWDKSAQHAYAASQPSHAGAIAYALGEHWLVCGMTGCGKTTFCSRLAKQIIRDYNVPEYILDLKPATEFDSYPGLIRDPMPPGMIESGQQVWRPTLPGNLRQDFALLDAYFGQILTWGQPCILWINELGKITYGERDPVAPDKYNQVMQTAREFGITVIAETQKLGKIPAAAKGQSKHAVRMRLSPAEEYSQRIGNRLAGLPPGTPEPRAEHGFFYHNLFGTEPGRYYASHSDFF